jgi:MoaA/NifB/PqqE/SkfB family radical SAM enzyme
MSLLVLFRTRLEWCNFTCGYCPWNAEAHKLPVEAFRDDERRLGRILDRVSELPQPVEFFITPKAEYLVLPYWRESVGRLLALPQVERVTIQTNLSFDLADFLGRVEQNKLALWTTYHPSEVNAAGLEELHRKWRLLQEHGVPFSVGMVGTRENLPHLRALRERLNSHVYLWVNAYQREPNYYSAHELAEIRRIDPYFELNNQHFPSQGQPCTAGQQAVYLDDEGDLRRCFFVGDVIGNLYRDGWRTLEGPAPCPKATCHCYVGHMHIVALDFRAIYGRYLAARIPKEWHLLPHAVSPSPRAGIPTLPASSPKEGEGAKDM